MKNKLIVIVAIPDLLLLDVIEPLDTFRIAQKLIEEHKSIEVVDNVRYVRDGKVLTTAGITSGLDGTLYVIEEILGKEIADNISKIMIYNRNGDLNFMNN